MEYDPVFPDGAYFDQAFRDGAPFKMRFVLGPDDIEIALGTYAVEYLADLVMPTGWLIACDGIVLMEEPFARHVPPGRYPVHQSLATFETGWPAGLTFVAAARVQFSTRQPVRWEMAVKPGEDPSTLTEDDELFGYGVDSARGGFLDLAAMQVHDAMSSEDRAAFTDRLIAEMWPHAPGSEGVSSMVFDQETGANLVAFYSGQGDGFYSSYWGFDSDGQVVCIVTDFGIAH